MKNTPRSRLLLTELVCDLCIFALCAVVCIMLLVYARSISQTSSELTGAVYVAQSAAELTRSADGLASAAALLGGTVAGGNLTVFYGRDWQPDKAGPYSLTVTVGPITETGLRTAEITVRLKQQRIYSITSAVFLPEEAPEHAAGEVNIP